MALTWHYTLRFGDEIYKEGDCLSTDTKPTTDGTLMNGSKLTEIDTSIVYCYNKDDAEWIEYTGGGSGTGGMEIHICAEGEYNAQTGVPTIADPDTKTFYLVPDGTGNDLFVEWIYVNDAWEKFGSARIDLSGYITGVTVNGTSVVNNGVAAIPKATSSAFGAVSPAAKTTSMVTAVGVDADGRLWASSDESKADQNGSYPQMTVGTAEQIATTLGTEDNDPYTLRKAGGTANVGKSEKDKIVGCSFAWNQMVAISSVSKTTTTSGVTYTDNRDGTYSVQTDSAGATAATGFVIGTYALLSGHIYYLRGAPSGSTSGTYYLYSTQTGAELGNGLIVQPSNNANATLSIPVKSGTIITTPVKFVPQLFDLTQMFGHTIATYIKSLETTTSGAGVAWFRKLFPKAYYSASNDTLQHVKTTAHKTIGFNQFDELWENTVLNSDGTVSSNSSRRTFTNYMRVFPNTTYCMRIPYSGTGRGAFYDESQNLISYYSSFPVSGNTDVFPNGTTTTPTGDGSYYFLFITPSNAQYFKYSTPGTNNANVCVNFHRNGERDGEYESYDAHVYPLAADISLRGVPLLDTNSNLYYSGDSYESNGTVTRRYGLLNLGSISSWSRITDNSTGISYYRCMYSAVKGAANNALANAITPKYRTVSYNGSVSIFNMNKTICITSSNKYICIRDDSYATAAALKTALGGVYIVYELATPTTETADTYTNPQIVNKFGTEEYVDTRDVPIPVGHETMYPVDLVEKLEIAPDTPSANGDYILRHANNTNRYVELADAVPVTDVQVNGTSVVTNKVANIPIADTSVAGVVKLSSGFYINNGSLALNYAGVATVKAGTNMAQALVPYFQHQSTFYGLAKAAGADMSSSSNAVGNYTDAAKSAIQTMLGVETGVAFIESVSGSTPSITGVANTRYKCGECSTLAITPPAIGTIEVQFASGSTATVLTVTPPTGITSKWPAWFDATSLDADTTYDIIITDGEFGSVMAWAD